MKAEPSRLIPRKLAATLELLNCLKISTGFIKSGKSRGSLKSYSDNITET